MTNVKTNKKVLGILLVAFALVAGLVIANIAEAGPSEERHETQGSNGISISVVGGYATEVSNPAGVTIPDGCVATSFELTQYKATNSKFAAIAYADENAWNAEISIGGASYSNSEYGFYRDGGNPVRGTMPSSGVASFTVNDADGAVVTLVSYPTDSSDGANTSSTSPQTGIY